MCKAQSGFRSPWATPRLTGQQYIFNTAFQYRLSKRLWPELEVNAMDYKRRAFRR